MSKRILVVDDDKLTRTGLVNRLQQLGMEVTEAVDGEDGLSKALTDKPDLIVTDVHMPKLGGLEMIDKLRSDKDWGKNVPIVVLTIDENMNNINDALEAGVTFYLSKNNMPPESIAEQIVIAAG